MKNFEVIHLTHLRPEEAELIQVEQDNFKKRNPDATKTAIEVLGMCGQMLSGSKSRYSDRNPKNLPIFNANVCTEAQGKIWYGDIDLTLSEYKIMELARLLECRVYVLYEMDARFNNEGNPRLGDAVYSSNGEDRKLSESLKPYFSFKRVAINKEQKLRIIRSK